MIVHSGKFNVRLRFAITSLITLTAGLLIGGCSREEFSIDNIAVGDRANVDIDPLHTDIIYTGKAIRRYIIVASKDRTVVCKATVTSSAETYAHWEIPLNDPDYQAKYAAKYQEGIDIGLPYDTQFVIDAKYINSLSDYVRLLYKDGIEPTEQTNAEAAAIEHRDGVQWSNLATEFFGWPFRDLIYKGKFEVGGIYNNYKKISQEEFLRMYKSGNLTGVFCFYGVVPTTLTRNAANPSVLSKYTPEGIKLIEEARASMIECLQNGMDCSMHVKYSFPDAKEKKKRADHAQPASQPAKK